MRTKLFLTLPLAALLLSAETPKKTAKMEPKEVKDPVCGMTVEPKTAAAKEEYKGSTYYFCSKEDKAEFDKTPDKFAKTAKESK